MDRHTQNELWHTHTNTFWLNFVMNGWCKLFLFLTIVMITTWTQNLTLSKSHRTENVGKYMTQSHKISKRKRAGEKPTNKTRRYTTQRFLMTKCDVRHKKSWPMMMKARLTKLFYTKHLEPSTVKHQNYIFYVKHTTNCWQNFRKWKLRGISA